MRLFQQMSPVPFLSQLARLVSVERRVVVKLGVDSECRCEEYCRAELVAVVVGRVVVSVCMRLRHVPLVLIAVRLRLPVRLLASMERLLSPRAV